MNKLLALLLLILLSPFFLLIGLLILLDDGFPILFTQKRVGVNYTFFKMYKFRTMKKDTPNVATKNNFLFTILEFNSKIVHLSHDT